MRQISEGIYGLLVSQGIANGRAGTRANGERKAPGAASDGARGGVVADTPEQEGDLMCPPIGRQGGWQPMGMRKSPSKAGAVVRPGVGASGHPSTARSHPVLTLVVSNKCEPTRPQSERLPPLGVGSHLVLVQ